MNEGIALQWKECIGLLSCPEPRETLKCQNYQENVDAKERMLIDEVWASF
jgi:hypothetical protein